MEMKIILVLSVFTLPVNAKSFNKKSNILNTLQDRVKREAIPDIVSSKHLSVDTYYAVPIANVSDDSINETITTEEPEVTTPTYGPETSFASEGESAKENVTTAEITNISDTTTEVPTGSSYFSSYGYPFSSRSLYISMPSSSHYMFSMSSSLSSDFSLPPYGSSSVSFEFAEPFKNKTDKDSYAQQSYSSLSSYHYWSSSSNFSFSSDYSLPPYSSSSVSFEFAEPFKNKNGKDSYAQQSYSSLSSYHYWSSSSIFSSSSDFSLPPYGSSTVSVGFAEPFKNKNDKDSYAQQSYSSLSSYQYWSSSSYSSSIGFEWPVIGNKRISVDRLKKKTDLLKDDVFDKLLKLKSLRDKEQKVESEVQTELDRGQMFAESIAKMMIDGPSQRRRGRN